MALERFLVVGKGRAFPTVIEVEDGFVTTVPDELTQFRGRMWDGVQETFKQYGWEVKPYDDVIVSIEFDAARDQSGVIEFLDEIRQDIERVVGLPQEFYKGLE